MNRRKSLIWQIPFLVLLIAGTVFIVIQQRNMPYRTNRGLIFGTEYTITYQNDRDLGKEIEQALQHVDNSLSPFNPRSLITKMNNNEDTIADKFFTEVYRIARKVSEDTGGAFDITVAPLVNAWGFGFKEGITPDKHTIDSLLQFVGYTKVRLDDNGRLHKADPRLLLDCSAVAKGYGCDVVARVLRGHDVLNYRNFYYKGGKRYAHTINPQTGYPVEHSLLSATVLARDCATADAYATSFMVMGMDRAREVLAHHPELMAYFIYSDSEGKNAVWFSDTLRDKICE